MFLEASFVFNKDCIFCHKFSPFSKHFVTQEKGDTIILINCADRTNSRDSKSSSLDGILSPTLGCSLWESGSGHYRKMGGAVLMGELKALPQPTSYPFRTTREQNRNTQKRVAAELRVFFSEPEENDILADRTKPVRLSSHTFNFTYSYLHL